MSSKERRNRKTSEVTSRSSANHWYIAPIVIWCFILYGNTLGNDYALDDHRIISDNIYTQAGFQGVADHLTTSYWEGSGAQVKSYRPISPVTFALEAGFTGINPSVSHLINLLLYIVTGMLFFRLVKIVWRQGSTTAGQIPAFIVTFIFLAHPVHTEAVANVKGRDTMLELLFLIVSVITLFSYINQRKTRDLFISALSFLLSLLSKESAIGFPILVVTILVLFDQAPYVKRLRTFFIYLAPVAVFLILFIAFSGPGEMNRFSDLDNMLVAGVSWSERAATTLFILGKYLTLLIIPHPLLYDYSFATVSFTGFTNPAVWIALVVYLFMIFYLLYTLVKKLMGGPVGVVQVLVAFSMAWFFMGFAATSNVFFHIGSTMAERFMYVPSAGFIFLVTLVPLSLLNREKSSERHQQKLLRSFYIFAGVLSVIYAVKTIDRNRDWKDDFTICTTDLKHLENNAKANFFVADFYKKLGDEALDATTKQEYYRKAIALKERAWSIHNGIPGINSQLGYLYTQIGRTDSAIISYSRAITQNPDDIFNYIQLYKVYGKSGRFAEGRPWLDKAEKLAPDDVDILVLQGAGWAEDDSTGRALAYFNRALVIDPSNSVARQYLQRLARKANADTNHEVSIIK